MKEIEVPNIESSAREKATPLLPPSVPTSLVSAQTVCGSALIVLRPASNALHPVPISTLLAATAHPPARAALLLAPAACVRPNCPNLSPKQRKLSLWRTLAATVRIQFDDLWVECVGTPHELRCTHQKPKFLLRHHTCLDPTVNHMASPHSTWSVYARDGLGRLTFVDGATHESLLVASSLFPATSHHCSIRLRAVGRSLAIDSEFQRKSNEVCLPRADVSSGDPDRMQTCGTVCSPRMQKPLPWKSAIHLFSFCPRRTCCRPSSSQSSTSSLYPSSLFIALDSLTQSFGRHLHR